MRISPAFFEHSLPLLHLHHTLQQSACEFPTDENVQHLEIVSQVARFSIFILIFKEYSEWRVWGGGLGWIITPYYVIHVFPFTDSMGVTTGRVRVTCADTTNDRFLLYGGASYA
jgi:hypothetical protein